jgi:FkbM family methyltransferase
MALMPCKPRVVYDIGGFDGASAEAFSLVADCDVYVFEPLSDMQDKIRARGRRDPRIHLQPTALGKEKKIQAIHRDRSKVAASSFLDLGESFRRYWPQFGKIEPVEAPIDLLDKWAEEKALPQPDLIKMDVQGMEIDVIEGGNRVFENARYLWMEMNFCEFFVGGSDFHSLYECVASFGFRLIDCIDLIRDKDSGRLLYMDGIFKKICD